MDGIVSEATDAQGKRLVGYHVHDALSHKRETLHGCARVVLGETQAGARC